MERDPPTAPAAPPSARRPALTAAAIFAVCLAVYHLNGRPQPEVDCVVAPYTAWSLVRHGSLDLSAYSELESFRGTELRPAPGGGWFAYRPPGAALAAVPFVAPLALFREQPLPGSAMLHLGKLIAASYAAGTVVVFFFLCRRLAPPAAGPATLLLALGTSLWSVASQALWMHGPATFWVCCALFLLTAGPGGRRLAAGAGLALGLAVLTRPSTALFAAASGCCLLAQRRWRDAAGLVAGAAGPVALFCLFNAWFFGDPVAGGYAHDPWGRSTPLWIGLAGLLVAPSRGLLVYSPALLLAPAGLWALFRRGDGRPADGRWMVLAWAAAAGLTTAFYGRWWDWTGGWCYGPRFLCEALPIACLLFALAYAAIRPVWTRRAAAGLVALSILVHFVGVFGHGAHADWCERHPVIDGGRAFFALGDTEIEAHARCVFQTLGALPRR